MTYEDHNIILFGMWFTSCVLNALSIVLLLLEFIKSGDTSLWGVLLLNIVFCPVCFIYARSIYKELK
jgi:hypothetical protein